MAVKILDCLNCGETFKSYNPNPKYCSKKCKAEFTKEKVDINRMIELYERGHTQEEVAIILETTQKVIFKRMKEVEYKPRVAFKRNQNGENNDSWKGGKVKHSSGYIMIKKIGHPRAKKCGDYVFEHILIIEKFLGRYLKEGEVVHHINENKQDNRLENLYLTNNSEHRTIHNLNLKVVSNLVEIKAREKIQCQVK